MAGFTKEEIDGAVAVLTKRMTARSDRKRGLLTIYNIEQLKVLHKKLVSGGYISPISVNTFTYFLSGKPLDDGIEKIQWLKSKKKAFYLFNQIAVGFSLQRMNRTVKTKHKPFDSNDRPSSGYDEIDQLLQSVE